MQKQKFLLLNSLNTFVDLTRFEQTLFGLPLILAGAILPFSVCSFYECVSWRWLLIIPAFLLARTSGMAFNQLIDRKIDAMNPRTQYRPLPTGRATPRQTRIVAWVALSLFLLTCLFIQPFCFWVAIFAAGLIYSYSYFKRFSWSCHFVLGMIHFLGPVMAALAISGQWIGSAVWLGLVAACAVSGNDIVYSIQDYAFDRSHQLHSAPARFGVHQALRVAQFVHGGCVVFLLCLACFASLNWVVFFAPLVVACILMDFHAKVKLLLTNPGELHRVGPLFFRSNVAISLITLLFVVLGLK